MGDPFLALARRAAYGTAALSIVYSVAFTIVVQQGARWAEWTAAAALTAGGLLAVPVLLGVTSVLGDAPDRAGLARLAGTVGSIAAVMTSLHGAYDLALLARPASAAAGDISPVDPRGFATFALSGLAIGVIALLARTGDAPRWLPTVGAVLGIALVATWVGRLAVVDPTSVWLRVTTTVAAVLSPIVDLGFAAALRRPATASDRAPALAA